MKCKDCGYYRSDMLCYVEPNDERRRDPDRPACRYFKEDLPRQPAPAFRWTAAKINEALNAAGIRIAIVKENGEAFAAALNGYMDRAKPEPEVKSCICGNSPTIILCDTGSPTMRRIHCNYCCRSTGLREVNSAEILADWNAMN